MNGRFQSIGAFPGLRDITLMLVVTSVLGGCNNSDMSDLKSYVSQVKSREKGSIEPLPEIKTVETFVFKPAGLRNPFIPMETTEDTSSKITVQNGIRPNTVRAKEELETYSLDSLRMVGTVNMSSTLWGLVQANDGTIHRVRNGNYLGRYHGKIIRIMENQIELLEIIPDGPGTWRERQASVKLSE